MSYLTGKFYGVEKIGQNLLINQLENNLKAFLQWGFLNAGGFVNIERSNNNLFNNAPYRLYPVEDPNYNNGQIWQTLRKDWIYESGIVVDGNSPVSISGIYIANTFYPLNTTGSYAYTLDYKNSRLIFNTKVATNLNISMNYSYRWVQIYNYTDADWWQELQYANDSSDHITRSSSGDFVINSKHRVQMPSIVIETVPRGSARPFRLGDKSLVMEQDLILHILADNPHDRNNIVDIIRLQQDKIMPFFDLDKVVKNNKYPFNFDGSLNNSRVQYDYLLNNNDYVWNTCRYKNMVVSEVETINPDLYESNIRITAEIIVV